jgi:hypothetical protein
VERLFTSVLLCGVCVSDQILNAITNACPDLTSLDLASSQCKLSVNSLIHLLTRCVGLTELKINGCENNSLTNCDYISVFAEHNTLTHLTLANCASLTNETVMCILINNKELKALCCMKCALLCVDDLMKSIYENKLSTKVFVSEHM